MSFSPVDRLALLALLAFLSLGGCGQARQEPPAGEPLLAVGRTYLDQGRYDQAAAVYQEAIRRDSLSRDAHFYLGLARLQRKSAAAAPHFARAIALDSTYIPSYHNLAIAHLEAGRYPQAVAAVEAALRFDPQSPSSYRLLAFLAKEQGQYERAEEALLKALYIAPQDVEARQALALLYSQQGRSVRAEEVLVEAAELAPERKEIWRDLGRLYLNEKRYEAAAQALNRAVALDAHYGAAYHDLANLYSAQGRYDEAEAMLVRLEGLLDLADREEALEKALARDPGNVEARLELGRAQTRLGHYADALNTYQEVLSRAPEHVDALAAVVQLHLRQGDVERAAHLAGTIEAHEPRGRHAPEAHFTMGFAHAQKQRWAEAEAAFARALALDACYAKAHNALGNVHALRGDLAKAIDAYRAALACNAELGDAYYGLGMALARRESLAEAIAQFEEVVRRDSTHARSHYALGQAYEQQGAVAAAHLAYGAFVRHWRGDDKALAAAQSRIAHLQTPVDYNQERRSLPEGSSGHQVAQQKHLF